MILCHMSETVIQSCMDIERLVMQKTLMCEENWGRGGVYFVLYMFR